MGYSHNTGHEGKKSEDCFSFLPAREFSIRIENAGADRFVMRISRINENFNLKFGKFFTVCFVLFCFRFFFREPNIG